MLVSVGESVSVGVWEVKVRTTADLSPSGWKCKMAAKIHCKNLVKFFVVDPNMIQNRYCFSQELGVLLADFKPLDDLYKLNVISAEELFSGIFHKWISKESEPPTLRKLLEVLTNLVGFKDLEGTYD